MNRVEMVKGLAVGLCIFFISAPLFAEMGRVAEISNIQGSAWFRKSGTTEWKGAEKGMILLENDEIKTGENAKVEILLDTAGETGKLDLEANTQMRFDSMKKDSATADKTTLLNLALGKVMIKVEKLQGSSSFQVKTPTSICGVRGTLFEVTVEAQ
ncbi:MAG: hypothetical protein A2351_07735 [Omnitrophica bacterium RIFOXYB12_FULL_50_7]|nr:MAG: hypothetical protein A2351_07735 [Omnitrophica bacterium RIFOXYB12_FULL_50_7]